MNKNERDETIDIIKAIGIISIVVGHSCWSVTIGGIVLPTGRFVYLYHLAIFVFCSGYLFKEINSKDPWQYVGKKLKGLWPMFVTYCTLFLFFRNIFIKMGIVDLNIYSKKELLYVFVNSIFMNNPGSLCGALWFVPVILLTSVFFCFIYYCTSKLRIVREWKLFLIGIISLLFGIMGVFCMEKTLKLNYHMEVVLILMPVFFVGYLVKCNWCTLKDKCKFSLAMFVMCIVFVFLIKYPEFQIELSACYIGNRWMYYPITFLCIYMCLGISQGIKEVPYLNKIMCEIGRNSFHIMALHFFCFKMIDYIIYTVNQRESLGNLAGFPISEYTFKIVYILSGILFPIIIIKTYELIRDFLRNKVVINK